VVHNVAVLDLPPGPVRLAREERRELRRLAAEGRPHPDPQVRRRAVAWARHPAPEPGRIAGVAAFGLAGVGVVAAGVWFGAGQDFVVFGLPMVLLTAAQLAGPNVAAIHRVNLAALLAEARVPAAPLEVAGVRPPLKRNAAAYAAFALCGIAAAATGLYLVTAACLAVPLANRYWPRLRPDHPRMPLRLDADGLHMPANDLHVPWTDVTAVDLIPAGGDAHLIGVAWRRAAKDFTLALDPRDYSIEDVVLTSRAWRREATA